MVRIRGLGRLKRLYAQLINVIDGQYQKIATIPEKVKHFYRVNSLSRHYYNPLRTTQFHLSSLKKYVENNGRLLCDRVATERYLASLEHESTEDFKWRNSSAYPAAYIAELNNMAFISRTSFLLTKNGELLSDDFAEGKEKYGVRSKLWDMEVDQDNLITKMTENVFDKKIFESGIYLMIEHDRNYFHWLVEVLPSLYLYEKMCTERNIPLLITDELHQNLYDVLNLVKDEKRPVIKVKPQTTYRIKRLITPPSVTRIFNVYDHPHNMDTVYVPVNLIKSMIKDIKSKLKIEHKEQQDKLYIRRSSTYRHLTNQDEIESALTSNGFKVIDPGVMSVEEQIEAFSNAEIIIGASGAAFANMMWCRPGTKVIIFYSHIRGKMYPYWDALARIANLDLHLLYGERAFKITGFFEAHDDYRVDVNDLIQLISSEIEQEPLIANG